MKNQLVLSFVVLILAGCDFPQQDEFDRILESNRSLERIVEDQSEEISELKEEIRQLQENERQRNEEENKRVRDAETNRIKEESSKPYISEAKAIEYLDKDYDFYNRGYVYKGLKVLRIGPNEFKFSMKESRKGNNKFYVDQIITLTVFNNGEYQLDRRVIH